MRLWKGKEVLQFLACLRSIINREDPRRKECCHPLDPGDLFKYMSALIKVSNHLALILPGKPRCIRKTFGLTFFTFSPYGHSRAGDFSQQSSLFDLHT
jgi:hypothetical protein